MKTHLLYTLTTVATVSLFPTATPRVSEPAGDLPGGKTAGAAADVFLSAGGGENRFDFAWEDGARNGLGLMQDGEKAAGGSAFSTAKSSGDDKGGDPLAWEVVEGDSGVSTGSRESIAELAQANAVTGASATDGKDDKKATDAAKADKGAEADGDKKAADDKAAPVKPAGAEATGGDKKPVAAEATGGDKKPAAENLMKKKAPAASISDLVGGAKKPAAGGTAAGATPASTMTTGDATKDPMEAIEGSAEEGFFIRDAQLNDVFQFLAQSAGLNYFHNAELAAPTYTVTGQLQDGDAIEQMKELGLMYGITIHSKGKTVYAMTESQLSQLPVKPFQYQMKYLRPSDMDQIKAILTPVLTPGRGSVDFETKTNTLVVMDNEQKVEALQEILEQLDKPKRQVAIEMRILRVTSGSRNRIGVDWSTVLGEDGIALGADTRLNNLFNLPDSDEATQVIALTGDTFRSIGKATGTATLVSGFSGVAGLADVTAGNPGSTVIPSTGGEFEATGVPMSGNGASTTVGVADASQFDGTQRILRDTRTIMRTNTGLVMDDVALDAVLRALNQGNLAEQESSPTLVTEDNEQGIISIIDRVPIIVATVNSTSAGTNVTEEVRYRIDVDDPVDDPANTREIGVTMSITPTILPDGTIRMVMRPRTAQIVEFIRGAGTATEAGIIAGNSYPRVSESTVDTIARVPDGSSLLIGGFYEQNNRDQESKVPILGDIPWVNFFFKSTDKEKSITSIVFVVTPSAYDAESPKGTMEMTKHLHDRQVLPFDHNWPDRKNPGFNHEANIGRTLGNALKLYPEVPEWNPLGSEHPINAEKTEAAAAQQPPANHRKPRNPLIRIFGFGKTQE